MFARANRFNYKNPDHDISPADFNIASSFNKGRNFQKCPRFRYRESNDGDDGSNSVCSHSDCCSDILPTCSTPREHENQFINSNNIKQKLIDFKNQASSKEKPRKTVTEKKHEQKMLTRTERNESTNYFSSEEFFDDYYQSYTSSEEFGGLKQINESESDEVCEILELLRDGTRNEKPYNDFETIILKKIDNIENSLDYLKSDITRLSNKMQKKQLSAQNSSKSQIKCYAVEEIVKEAITKLHNDFEDQRKDILVNNQEKIEQLIREMYACSNRASQQTKKICERTASDLSKKIFDILTHESDNFRQVEEDHDCFNYENICKILSDQLQESKDELAAFEQHQMDFSMKYSGVEQALENHTSVIRKLNDQIAAIRINFSED